MGRVAKVVQHVIGTSDTPDGARVERSEKSLADHLGALKRRALRYAQAVRWSFDRRAARIRRSLIGWSKYRREMFQNTYRHRRWGTDDKSEFFSGVGSRGPAAEVYIEEMAALLKSAAAELGRSLTIVDLGCGDFSIGAGLISKVPGSLYIGCDIVPELIAYNRQTYGNERVKFLCLDIVTDTLPQGDVYLVRQVLQHLSNAEVMKFLQRANCACLYVTEGHPKERVGPVNPDIVAGADIRFDWFSGRGRGLELDQPPFCLTTRDVFRAFASKGVIVTERVFL